MPLDGPDAQVLEGALQQVERELATARAEVSRLQGALADVREIVRTGIVGRMSRHAVECQCALCRVIFSDTTAPPDAIRSGR
jgi:hypothetical protein